MGIQGFGTSKNVNKKANVMTPLNWCAGLLGPSSVYGLVETEDETTKIFLMAVIAVVGLFYLLMYLAWAVFDPNRLQSEQFILESQALIADQNKVQPVIDDSTTIDIGTNKPIE